MLGLFHVKRRPLRRCARCVFTVLVRSHHGRQDVGLPSSTCLLPDGGTCRLPARRSLSVGGHSSQQLRNDDPGAMTWFGPTSSSFRNQTEDVMSSCTTKGAFRAVGENQRCPRWGEPAVGGARGGGSARSEERAVGGAHGRRSVRSEKRIVVVRVLGRLIRNEVGGGTQGDWKRAPGTGSPSASEAP
jgi:hypothetical protein